MLGESYAMRTFKDHVGITIVDYLNRYRILQSLQLLDRHYKHYEIARQSRLFRSIKCLAIILKIFTNVAK